MIFSKYSFLAAICLLTTVIVLSFYPISSVILVVLSENTNLASILLSAVTLWLLLTSTLTQMNQERISQLHSSRSLQIELLRISLEVPEYREVLGSNFSALDTTKWRQHAYLNMWVMYIQMSFLTGSISEKGIRRFFSGEFFDGKPGINYWTKTKDVLSAEASSRQHKKFIKIVNDEYRKSVVRKQGTISEAITGKIRSSEVDRIEKK